METNLRDTVDLVAAAPEVAVQLGVLPPMHPS